MSTLTRPAPARWSLPSRTEAAGCARQFARDWLTAWVPDAADAIADACLMVSELVANAVEHGAPPVTLAMSADYRDDQAVVAAVVHDGGARLPRVFAADPGQERHRGMAVIGAIADKWGVREAADGGKDVWFRITVLADVTLQTHQRIPYALTPMAEALLDGAVQELRENRSC